MKVLTSKGQQPSVLILSPEHSDKFLAMDGTEHTKGVVADLDERVVSAQAGAALRESKRLVAEASAKARAENPDGLGIPFGTGGPFRYLEKRDITRDLKFITRCITDVPDGVEVGVNPTRRGVALDIPESAKPDRAAGLAVGAKVAVAHNISPKALANAHGVVASLKGTRVMVQLDEHDKARVVRETGRDFENPVSLPKGCIEVIAATDPMAALRDALAAADGEADADPAVAFLTLREAVEAALKS